MKKRSTSYLIREIVKLIADQTIHNQGCIEKSQAERVTNRPSLNVLEHTSIRPHSAGGRYITLALTQA